MKKLVITIVVILLIGCLTYSALRPVYAAPGDVEIKLVIRAAKVADFQAGFLAKCPIPLIQNPADPDGPRIPEYTPKQWIKEWIRREVMKAYRHGKRQLALQTAVVDPNAIQ